MSSATHKEILSAALAPAVLEVGGGHGQKGVDFQRYWAISRIIELVSSGEPDFLILFESLQDIAEFDSPANPSRARLYQLKMKNAGEWTWKALTALPAKARRKKGSRDLTDPPTFPASHIGKLATALAEFESIPAEGIFVSNSGCDAERSAGSTASSVRLCKFSELSKELQDQIRPELQSLTRPIEVSALSLHKTELALNDLDVHVSGKVFNYLESAAPRHKAQAKSFSDSLFAKLSGKGRKTDTPATFADLLKSRGYSKADFIQDVDDLRSTPDQEALINTWMAYLVAEKMPLRQRTRLQVKIMQIFEQRLKAGIEDGPLVEAVRAWSVANPPGNQLLPYLTAGLHEVSTKFPNALRDEVQALLILEGIAHASSESETSDPKSTNEGL